MTDLPNGAVVEEFSKQVLNLHMITIDRLFEIDSDATLLYIFMTKNAVHQQTNSIWCTNTFIMKGLKWGKMRVTRAKDILEKHNFVEKITPKKNGRFEKHYIKIKYLENPKYSNQTTTCGSKEKLQPQHVPQASKPAPVSPPVVRPAAVKQPQMLNTKELNAYNKKVNAYTPEFFFDLWNKQRIIVHKEINGRIPLLVSDVLKLISGEQFTDCIRYYKQHLVSDDSHWTHKWRFEDFMARGLSKEGMKKGGGFWHFIDNPAGEQNHDPWDTIRKEFLPLTSNYTEIFSKTTQRYYGFTKDHINSEIRWEDVEYLISKKLMCSFSQFMELEWMIAGMLFRRKQEPGKLEICKLYMRVWQELKLQFKSEARTWLKNDFEFHG